eukprot:105613-Pelagomonas_calceolata.AAC.3
MMTAALRVSHCSALLAQASALITALADQLRLSVCLCVPLPPLSMHLDALGLATKSFASLPLTLSSCRNENFLTVEVEQGKGVTGITVSDKENGSTRKLFSADKGGVSGELQWLDGYHASFSPETLFAEHAP